MDKFAHPRTAARYCNGFLDLEGPAAKLVVLLPPIRPSALLGCRVGDCDSTGEFQKQARCVHLRQHYFDEPRLSEGRGTLQGVVQLADGTDLRGAYVRATEGGGQVCPVPRDDVLVVGLWTLDRPLDGVAVVVEHEQSAGETAVVDSSE